MDMEKLNKSQIVLLTLFVSFMTSIATGIVTVSLMEQAPPAITETVNRVVEHTVERVVQGQAAAAVAPEIKTIVLHESELIPKAVDAAGPSIVRIYSNDPDKPLFLGLGIVVDAAGIIALDTAELGDLANVSIELSGSLRVPGSVRDHDTFTGITYIAGATSTTDGPLSWKPAKISSGKSVLGQTVVLISGRSATRVGQGLITAISPSSAGEGAPVVLETNIQKDGILLGSPIIDTDGNVLGLSTSVSRGISESGFISGIPLHPQKNDAKDKEAAKQ